MKNIIGAHLSNAGATDKNSLYSEPSLAAARASIFGASAESHLVLF